MGSESLENEYEAQDKRQGAQRCAMAVAVRYAKNVNRLPFARTRRASLGEPAFCIDAGMQYNASLVSDVAETCEYTQKQ